MQTYEIINPSDPYTLQATSDQVAIVATMILGCGQMGLADEEGNTVLPLLFLSSKEEFKNFCAKKNIPSNSSEFLKEGNNRSEVVDALSSVLLGTFKDRRTYDRGLKLIETEEGKREWKDQWHDERSSYNDIGRTAWKLAESLKVES